MKLFIGLDNGVTGSCGFMSDLYSDFVLTPVKKEQNYTKKKDYIHRIDVPALTNLIRGQMFKANVEPNECLAVLERPMINSVRFSASVSAARSLEATLCVLESLGIGYTYIDSKQWQRDVLPKGIEGSAELKKASADIGIRLFPQYRELINKHKDADGLLIAYWAYKNKI